MKAGKHQITLRARGLRMIFLDLSTGRSKGLGSRVASNISMKTTMVLENSFFRPSVTEYFKRRFHWLVRMLFNVANL